MKFPRASIAIRLTALFATTSTVVLLMLGLLIGYEVEQHFVEQDMDLMSGKLRLVGHLLERLQTPADLDALPTQLDDSLVGHHGLTILVLGADNQRRFATTDAEFPVGLLDRARIKNPPVSQTWKYPFPDGPIPMRGIAALVPVGIQGMQPLLVAVAVDITHHQVFMASFKRTLWQFVSVAAVLAGILGWAVVRRGLAPLHAIGEAAAAVTASRLDYRLAVDAVPVELVDLVATMNDMLARLEASFQRLKDFSADLAHELRTPVTNLMTQTQVALVKARTTDEYREILASNAEEFDRLARMIGDMLFLAQADNGLIVPNREPVDLAAEVSALFEFFDALAADKALHLSLTGSGTILGDKLMLRRAVANLLANAIRHTPAHGSIKIDIKKTAVGVALSIENSGDTIAPEQLLRLFDRFYRVDQSRHNISDGAGLGLAITRSIIQAHGGEIHAESGSNGTCFELRMTSSL
ncbi:MAG: heavy metal sensor histidine kinase [Rhodocyclaceae bacterium]|nr:heavy metal sensor histidine kinase [Rhodocyclaceae bacterium]